MPTIKHKELALMTVSSVLAGTEAAHFFSSKLPSTMTIQSFVSTRGAYDAIIDGLIKANLGSAILAGIITVASKVADVRYWYLPAVATAGVCGFLTWSYLDDLKKAPFVLDGTASAGAKAAEATFN